MTTTGMTLKQFARHRFFKLCEEMREAVKHTDTEEGRRAYILLALQLHAAKGGVPKSLWKYANRAARGE